MNELPHWVPPMADVRPWHSGTYDLLYGIFKKDFVLSQPLYEGLPVWHYPEKEDGKEKIFWHMTTCIDRQMGERLPDLNRAERLPWARPLIGYCGDKCVWAWDYKEGGGNVNTYVWLKDHDYVVLMKKYNDGRRRLLTAYHVARKHERKKLEKKYKKRIN